MASYFQEVSFEDEWAQEAELAGEFASEAVHEHEAESESESFFNNLATMAERGGRSRALRRVAIAAARAAMKGRAIDAPGRDGEFGEYEEEYGEFSGESAFLESISMELSPAAQSYAMAQMEHLAHAAAEAETEQEAAEQFLPLIGLAAKALLPLVAKKALPFAMKVGGKLAGKVLPRVVGKVAPQLTRGISNITRLLHRHPATRPLLNVVPRIARGTMLDILRRYGNTGKLTPKIVMQLLAKRTANTISNPAKLARTYQRSVSSDARYHRQVRGAVGGGRAAQPLHGPITSAPGGGGTPSGTYGPGGSYGDEGGGYTGGNFGGEFSAGGGCTCRCRCRCGAQ